MIIIWILAVLFTVNSISITIRSNFNTGVLMMWLISLILIAYGVFHRYIDKFTSHGAGRVLKVVFISGVIIFAGLFAFVAVSGYSGRAKGNEKALIVLGAGIRGEKVGDVLRRRLEAALSVWRQNPDAVIVVTGGQGPQENIPEALAMERWLTQQGVPASQIIREDKSASTQENLTFARTLLEEAGISREAPIAIVTNAFHCYRARSYAEKLGFSNICTVPASISPTIVMASYMREVLAILFMWVFRHNVA